MSVLLNAELAELWIAGEVSNLFEASSGHVYFSLKDDQSQVKCALFRQRQSLLNTTINDGDQVIVRATASLFKPRGDFQLLVQTIEDAGEGRLRKAFEELKITLAKEGLFDTDRKQALPGSIDLKSIAVITSPQGAVIHDIITTLNRRCPLIHIVVLPSLVQGIEAAQRLSEQIDLANTNTTCDVIIIARGGGSLEDLSAFNDEQLARTITASKIPVVSAVGHETDFTICDLVADVRATTPTAAAELVSPDQQEIIYRLNALDVRLRKIIRTTIIAASQSIDNIQSRLRTPQQNLALLLRDLNQKQLSLTNSINHAIMNHNHRLNTLKFQFLRLHPAHLLADHRSSLATISEKIISSSNLHLKLRKSEFDRVINSLHIVSPLATLDRGYCIVSKKGSATIVKRKTAVKKHDELTIQMTDGKIDVEVS